MRQHAAGDDRQDHSGRLDQHREPETRRGAVGEETDEAKTDVEFSMIDPATGEETSLNSLDRNGTDKEIRKIFGTIDDFLLTSMSSQMGAMTFINEGSTKRKEILAKFLDLDQFEKKFRASKNDSIETRALLKKLEDNNFDAALATIYRINGLVDVVRIYKKDLSLEELKKINTYRVGIPSTVESVGMYIYSFFGLEKISYSKQN